MLKPKFKVGEVVELVAAGIRGEVVEVDKERDIYTVKYRSFVGKSSRVQLRSVPAENAVGPTYLSKYLAGDPEYDVDLVGAALAVLSDVRDRIEAGEDADEALKSVHRIVSQYALDLGRVS